MSKAGQKCKALHPTYQSMQCMKRLGHNGFHKAERPNPIRPETSTHVVLWHRRGLCGVCGKDLKILQDGTLMCHGTMTGPPFQRGRKNSSNRGKTSLECDGSWTKPVKVLPSELYIEEDGTVVSRRVP